MHRPAPFARPLQPLRESLRGLRASSGGGPSIGAKILAGLIVFVVVLGLAALYTPIAHPRDLEVDGATGLSANQIRAALDEEGRRQSTFNPSEDDLMAAVADYPEVAAVRVSAHPPFRLDLTVVMRPPVGRAQIGGRSFTVAGDGTVLERADEAAVPKLDDTLGSLLLRDGRLTGDGGALAVLAGAPETLLELVRTVRRGQSGLEVELQRGPRLIFGSAEHAADKWAAATAVIADGNATRATYIDVRVPGRPAVGGLGGSKAAGASDAPPTLTPGAAPGAGVAATATASTATGPGAGAATGGAAASHPQTQTPTGTAQPQQPQDPATGGGSSPSGAANGTGTGATAPAGSGSATPATGSAGAQSGGGTGVGGITP